MRETSEWMRSVLLSQHDPCRLMRFGAEIAQGFFIAWLFPLLPVSFLSVVVGPHPVQTEIQMGQIRHSVRCVRQMRS